MFQGHALGAKVTHEQYPFTPSPSANSGGAQGQKPDF
jgi:hypothetical protein